MPISGGGDGALVEGALSALGDAQPLVPMGLNSLLQTHWLPPDPPRGHGVHRYLFQIYALESGPALPQAPGRDVLRKAIIERGLASGGLVGTYERKGTEISEPLGSQLATGA